MSYDGLPDANTSIPFHLFLLGIAGITVIFGVWLFALPLVGWVASRWIVMYVAYVNRRAEEFATSKWHGRFFSFEGSQVRVHWDDENIWIIADDIFQVMQREPDGVERKKIKARAGDENYRQIPGVGGECLSEEGVARYLAGLRVEDTRKLRLWLDREVFPVIKRNRESGSEIFTRHQIRD